MISTRSCRERRETRYDRSIPLSLHCRSFRLEPLEPIVQNIAALLLVHGEATGEVTTIKGQLSASKEHFSLSEKTYSCSLFLPGMFAPMYQESEMGKRVLSLSSVTLRFHSSLRSLASASMIQSPWHSTQDGPLLKAVGPWAP
jgi:hypothetical protein